jgi:uncharacterized membrane protein YgcG
MPRKKRKKKKQGGIQKKKTTQFGFDNISNLLPGNWKTKLETLRNEMNKVNIPSKRPGNIYYNINNAGVVTDTRDFVYDDGTYVERGTEYHIHIDPDTKEEVYMTEGVHSHESETITRVNGATLLGQYIGIRGKKPEKEYLKSYDWSPTKKDIKRGFAIRTFVRQAYGAREVYEVSELDAEKSGILYEKIQVDWAVGYNKELVFDSNEKNLEILEEAGYTELLDELDELDGYLGDEDPLMTKLLDMVPKKPKFEFDPQDFGGKKKVKKGAKKKKKKKKKSGMGSSGGTQGGSSGSSSGGGSGGGGGAY